MIVMDFSQVMLSNIMMQIGNHTDSKIEESMCRHMVLNSIRLYKNKFGAEYGDLVIACDNKNYWRRKIFPYYKANRKKSQAASELDWNAIFECLNKIREELKEYFPYRVIDVETAEADDIIGTLCATHGVEEEFMEFQGVKKILILSGDKDFIQLHRYKNVQQYDPVRKKFIVHSDPIAYRNEHVMKGDSGDGIPNVLSPDNCFVVGERQKPLTQKRLDDLLSGRPMATEVARNYMRNKQLIDLAMIPVDVSEKILESYKEQSNKKNGKNLMNYFIANRLKHLTESIGDFL